MEEIVALLEGGCECVDAGAQLGGRLAAVAVLVLTAAIVIFILGATVRMRPDPQAERRAALARQYLRPMRRDR